MGGGLSALDEATKEGKRPGRKGGEQEKEEGREKPGAAPPGEPRAAAGTFVSAPNSQPGKRELEREEERRGGGSLREPGKRKRGRRLPVALRTGASFRASPFPASSRPRYGPGPAVAPGSRGSPGRPPSARSGGTGKKLPPLRFPTLRCSGGDGLESGAAG